MSEPIAVSVTEARRNLGGISTATVYRMLSRGTLKGRRIGGRRLILMASIKSLLGDSEVA